MSRPAILFLFVSRFVCSVFATTVPEYDAMRAARLDGRTVAVKDFTLVRDAYRLNFHSGAFHLLAPAAGRTFGAVFMGEGSYELQPATLSERRQLALIRGEKDLQTLTDSFQSMVLLFADVTAAELSAHAETVTGTPDGRANAAYEEHLRQQKNRYRVNLHLRVLGDLLNGVPEKDGVFLAAVDGKRLGPALLVVDRAGIGNLAAGFAYFGGEETAFLSFDDQNGGFWYLSSLQPGAKEGRGKPLRLPADAQHYAVDTVIKSNSEIEGSTTIRFQTTRAGVRVLPVHIMPKLRISEAFLGETALGVIQEEVELGRLARLFRDEVADADAAIVFPSPLAAAQTVELRIRYGGRDVLQAVGMDSYSVRARESWYPNLGTFNDTATYHLTFRYPRKNQLVSVGERVSEQETGNEKTSVWKSDEPMRIAGFNYGRFHKVSRIDEESKVAIDVYTNPDFRKKAEDTMVDAINTSRVGTIYFGQPPHSPVSVTQQTEWNFGQSWPSLVYLPTLAMITSTERVAMFDESPTTLFAANEFAKTVGWHEFAHQWWGHLVGWESYRDAWLSEGFSEFTAALVLHFTEGGKNYVNYWERRRDDIFSRRYGTVANNDAGPISQGFRLATRRSPQAAQAVIYAKGGFVLHMLRMMMRGSGSNPDEKFIAMMRDFIERYREKNPSTADFQKIVEAHMVPTMNAAGNGKMDWFFNQWVYGTEVPKLTCTAKAEDLGQGKYRISGTLRQEGVSDGFISVIPLYLDFGNDQLARIGAIRLVGNTSQDLKGELPLPQRPRRVMINAWADVLTRD